MNESSPISLERMIEVALGRGLALDAARARAMQPAVESLRGRLAALARDLPPDAAPAPGPPDVNR